MESAFDSASGPGVLVVDDQPVSRLGIRSILEKSGRFRVVGEHDGPDGLGEVCSTLRPDIVVLDTEMGERRPLETLRALVRDVPGVRVLAYGPQSERDLARICERAGAAGYVSKQGTGLVDALSKVAAGHRVRPPRQSSPAQPIHSRLTARELEVLLCVGAGMRTGEVATYLGVRPNTVSVLLGRIRRKTGLESTSEMTLYVLEERLRDPEGFRQRVVTRSPDPDKLDVLPYPAMVLSPSFEIARVNAAFRRIVAEASGGEDFVARWSPGSDFIAACPKPMRSRFRRIFASAPRLDSRRLASVHAYESASETRFRLFEMHVNRLDTGEFLLAHRVVIDREHDPKVRVPSEPNLSNYRREDGKVDWCASCRRVRSRVSGAWEWVPEWIWYRGIDRIHQLCGFCAIAFATREPG